MVTIADTTFFGNDFGVTVLRDWYEKENVFVKFVERETMKTYREGFEFLKKRGCDVLGLVSDGKRGLLFEGKNRKPRDGKMGVHTRKTTECILQSQAKYEVPVHLPEISQTEYSEHYQFARRNFF